VAPTRLIDRLRARQWRLTPQRRVVGEVLDGPNVHFTADEVLAHARRRLPEISRATVYNTLNELVEMGEVRAVTVTGGPVRYDPNVDQRHHHLVCTQCGALVDVRPGGVEGLRLAPSQRHGFRLDGVDVTFRGRCRTCLAGGSELLDVRLGPGLERL
jgi:Fe2+ or Zn2+ uptake regulation protein